MIFWALEERKKRRERLRAEARAEEAQRYEIWLAKVAAEKDIPLSELLPPSEGYTKGFSEGLATGYAAAKREFDKQLEHVAAEKGIPLADLLPPQNPA